MAKPTLTGQSKRLTRRPGGEMNSIDLIPPVDPPSDEGYFTDLIPFLTTEGDVSRIVYLSNSGNDTTAASNQHSRGYYIPSDPEIGPDPTNPVGPIYAFATLNAARTRVRSGVSPDWLLYERGGTFDLGGLPVNIASGSAGPSVDKRKVFSAYGDVSLPRPKILNAPNGCFVIWGSSGARNLVVSSFDFTSVGPGSGIGASNILIEDCAFYSIVNLGGNASDWVIRRCSTRRVWSANSHNFGMYMEVDGGGHILEENVFDWCGYKESPSFPATWTGNKSSDGSNLSAGSGVQPRRTFYDRSLYVQWHRGLTLKQNLICRGGGGASVQMRTGGVVEENVFMWNHTALLIGGGLADRRYLMNATLSKNLVLHEDHFVPPGGYGGGFLVSVGNEEEALVEQNIIAHFIDRNNNGDSMIRLLGLPANSSGAAEQSKLISVLDNDLLAVRGETLKINGPDALSDGVKDAIVNRNAVYRGTSVAVEVSSSSDASWPDIGETSGNGNSYHAPGWSGFATWQANGRDTQSTNYSTLAALAAAAGWKTAEELNDPQGRNGWERDIVSYMQNVDPEYVVDESVTVDFGAPAANRRESAPVLWQVLNTGSPTYNMPALSEAESKLAARRYHAFVTFIDRAKDNRKGAWDSRYTAKALNNYMRAGLGRTLIT
jgi:hypothetical protein